MRKTTFHFHFGLSITVETSEKKIIKSRLTLKKLPTSGEKELINALRNFQKKRQMNLKNYELDLSHISGFQRRVYAKVLEIPFGTTKTYGEIARELMTSPRAIGQALKKNPFPLFIPCHRVVSKEGIGGFSQGTLIKEKLLKFERGG